MENKATKKGGFKSVMRKIMDLQEITAILPLLVMIILVTAINPVFVKPANLAFIAKYMAIWGLLAVGETFIMITGEIDVSVGSMTSFCAMFFAYLIVNIGLPVIVALILMMLAAVLLSGFNGFCVVKLKLPAFIATIAMVNICKGLARFLTYADRINVFKVEHAQKFLAFGTQNVFGLNWAFIFFIVIIVVAALVLKKTKFGHQVIATGDSPQAARISGVDTNRIKMATYMISGVMVALTAMFLVGKETVANPSNGDGWELNAIAACAIGGISMDGGSGSMFGSLLGVAFIAGLVNAMNLLAINNNWQTIMMGVVIVLACVMDVVRRNKKFGVKI